MFDDKYEFDVFISYSHKDAEWVTDTLVPRLEKTGLKVCIDNRDFTAGESAILNMQESIKNSKRILLVLTPNWVASKWTNLEAEIAQITPVEKIENRIVPLLWKKCDVPEHLARLTWVDFTDTDNLDHISWQQLLRSLGLPESKIRQAERKPPEPESSPKESEAPSHPVRNLFVFLATLVVMVTMVVLVALYGPSLLSTPDPTATPTSTVTETSQPTATEKPSSTRLATSTDTRLPTDTPTQTPTLTPTSTPDPICIDANLWTPFMASSSVSPVLTEDNCYDLNQWGISLYNGTFTFYLYGTHRADFYGIASNIPANSTITFTFKVNAVRDGEFLVGISQTENPEDVGVYFVALDDGSFDIRSYSNGHMKIEIQAIDVPFDTNRTYIMQLILNGNKLTFSVNNGTYVSPAIQVPFSTRKLYLGMRPFANGLVDVDVSNVTLP